MDGNEKHRRAHQVAKKAAGEAADFVDLHNRLYGIDGEFARLFATEKERAAFLRSEYGEKVHQLFANLPLRKAPKRAREIGDKVASANGTIIVRLPKSLHAALVLEAEAEGISLNQLCVSKLAVQLRAELAS
jgi:predicted HicB family RNase H-like nuclease